MTAEHPQWDEQGVGDLTPPVFRHIVDNTAYAFVVIDEAGVIVYVGASMRHVLGFEPLELVGDNVLDYIHPDDVTDALGALTEIEEINRTGAGVPMIFRLRHADGDYRFIEVGTTPVPTDDDRVLLPLRLRDWSLQAGLDQFIEAVTTGASGTEVLRTLAAIAASSVEAAAVVIHHGFDGARFRGDVSSVPLDAELVDAPGPWLDTAYDGAERVVATADLPGTMRAAAEAAGFGAVWAVRVAHEDAAPAVVTVWRGHDPTPLSGHRQALRRVTRYLRLALVQASNEQALRFLADHDALTGLMNRACFRDELAEALRNARPDDLALAFCDLDGFKAINDTYGHGVGDRVLVAVAGRLHGAVKRHDLIGREGGDEFLVLLRGVSDDDTAQQVGDRIAAQFVEPFNVDGLSLSVTMSIGVARHRPGGSLHELVRAADKAVYEAKATGGASAVIAVQA